jgi:hypothetical protein
MLVNFINKLCPIKKCPTSTKKKKSNINAVDCFILWFSSVLSDSMNTPKNNLYKYLHNIVANFHSSLLLLTFVHDCWTILHNYTLVENNEVIMLNKNYKYKKKHLNLDGLYFDLEQYFWGIIHFEVLCKSLKKIYSQPPNYPYNSKKNALYWIETNTIIRVIDHIICEHVVFWY